MPRPRSSRSSAPVSRRTLLAAAGATATLATTGTTARAAPPPPGYKNPVEPTNHPDPAVLYAEGSFWLYSTAGSMGAMPVLKSPDLINWTEVGNGMPVIADWSVPGRHWAPEVLRLGTRYLSYYTARRGDIPQQAVSVAVANSPAGPFVDNRSAPLIGQSDEGGSIDASPFRDTDGSLWLLWKNDGKRGRTAVIHLPPTAHRRRPGARRRTAAHSCDGPPL